MFKTFFGNGGEYRIMWGKVCKAKQVRDADITWRMRFTCCITKATDTHSEYFIFRILIFDGKNG